MSEPQQPHDDDSAVPEAGWQVEALWQQLSPLLPGISIEVLARSESTNTALLERVRSKAGNAGGAGGEAPAYGRRVHDMQPCLLVAVHQTQGRGRLGRSWISSAGGSLTFSLGLVLDMPDWSGLSLAVGCAVAEALEPLADPLPAGQAPRLQLKWPNDIWLVDDSGAGRKLGGILIETVQAGAQRMAVVGIGLNVNEQQATPADAVPPQFSTGYAALNELFDPPLDPPAVLARIAPALARALHDFPQTGLAPWQAPYARRDLTLGRAITAGSLEGVSRGIDAGGALQLETPDGKLHAISGGEVSVRLAG